MPVEGLEHYSKDQLIEELINRQTFVGVVIFHRGDAKAGRLDAGELVMTKSPPLTREGVEQLLQVGESLVPGMFSDARAADGAAHSLPLHAERPPLRIDEGDVVRVSGTRITLDLVIDQYESGMTPEDMVRACDSLELADVYAVIGWYVRHKGEVADYLKQRAEQAEALRAKIESERPRVSRNELLARRAAREKDVAPAGQ